MLLASDAAQLCRDVVTRSCNLQITIIWYVGLGWPNSTHRKFEFYKLRFLYEITMFNVVTSAVRLITFSLDECLTQYLLSTFN